MESKSLDERILEKENVIYYLSKKLIEKKRYSEQTIIIPKLVCLLAIAQGHSLVYFDNFITDCSFQVVGKEKFINVDWIAYMWSRGKLKFKHLSEIKLPRLDPYSENSINFIVELYNEFSFDELTEIVTECLGTIELSQYYLTVNDFRYIYLKQEMSCSHVKIRI